MPVNAVMLLRLREPVNEEWISALRYEFMNAFDLAEDDFYYGRPFVLIKDGEDGTIPELDDESYWINANLLLRYFGKNYEKGDGELIVKYAEWLEQYCDDCEIWYGHDINDDNLSRFGSTQRATLLELCQKHQKRFRYDNHEMP